MYNNVGAALAAMKRKKVGGQMKYEEDLGRQLRLLNPTETTISDVLAPGLRETIQLLGDKGKKTFLISRGVPDLVNPLADELGEPTRNLALHLRVN